MSDRIFTTEELDELGVESTHLAKEHVRDRRWSDVYRVVFSADDGKLYSVLVEEGATEYQEYCGVDVYPAREQRDNDWVVSCPEMEPYQVTVTKYQEVTGE